MTLQNRIHKLFDQQYNTWDLLNKNVNNLDTIQTKELNFDNFKFIIQFNPARIVSASAKIDERSLKNRKCFLCKDNLPNIQESVNFNDDFVILTNPFPIFKRHFVISSKNHIDQRIKGNFGVMLSLARELSDYTVIYNGPNCGASAPDHLHFQAGEKNFLPIDMEIDNICNIFGEILFKNNNLEIISINDNYLRNIIFFKSSNRRIIEECFSKLYNIINQDSTDDKEPLMNIQASYNDDTWEIILYLRKKHRSSHYYAEGDQKILTSPGIVDFGGVMPLPRKEDFDKITCKNIIEIYSELTIENSKFKKICNKIKFLNFSVN